MPPAREWASIGAVSDPVEARMFAASSLIAEWQWTPLPADFARIVTASGVLGLLTRLLTLGGAHADRCAWSPVCLVRRAAPATRGSRSTGVP